MTSQTGTPKTQILLTVGTNELPVLVAACRLAKQYKEKDGVWPGFTFIHSAQTGGSSRIKPEKECKRIKERMEKELVSDSVLPILEDFVYLKDPYSPDEIRSRVREKLTALKTANPKLQRFCLAYTGGTKAMAVHGYEAVKECGLASEAFYLHPLQNRLVPSCGVEDERAEFGWSIEELAGLHGFTTDFKRGDDAIQPVQPSEELVAIGCQMYEWFRKYQWTALVDGESAAEDLKGSDYNRWFKGWRREWSGGHESERYRVGREDEKSMPSELAWFEPDNQHGGQDWRTLTKNIAAVFPAQKGGWPDQGKPWKLKPGLFLGDPLAGLCRFVKHQFLELQVYSELRAALKEVDYPAPPKVYHDLHLARIGTERDLFSLNVAAVVGYQLLAVSCAATTSESSIRQAGFEALHRARQVGGDHAVAMVLCPLSATQAKSVEDSLHDDIGVIAEPLAVRSIFDKNTPIQKQFRKLLQKARIRLKPDEGNIW